MHTRSKVTILFALLLAGCGSVGAPQLALPSPSHGGTMVALPGAQGYVELKTESEDPPRGGRTQERKSQIVAFFYQADGTSPLTPAPSDVIVKVGTGDKSPTVPLSPAGQGSDSTNRFASKPGPYPDGFQGQLEAKLNGQPVQVTFLFR
jgi:hypothetical protein